MPQNRVHPQYRHKVGSGYYFVNVLSDQVAAHHLLPYVSSSRGMLIVVI
jgi:hypothetical protein